MNQAIPSSVLNAAESFSDYARNQAARINTTAESKAQAQGARVGISRPHESAQWHVAGEAA